VGGGKGGREEREAEREKEGNGVGRKEGFGVRAAKNRCILCPVTPRGPFRATRRYRSSGRPTDRSLGAAGALVNVLSESGSPFVSLSLSLSLSLLFLFFLFFNISFCASRPVVCVFFALPLPLPPSLSLSLSLGLRARVFDYGCLVLRHRARATSAPDRLHRRDLLDGVPLAIPIPSLPSAERYCISDVLIRRIRRRASAHRPR